MITWHKCSEKMPEVGSYIVHFDPKRDGLTTGRVNDYGKGWGGVMFENNPLDYEIPIGLLKYWAYDSEFNFPETKDE